MKRFFYFFLIILISFCVLFPQEVLAGKKKDNKKSSVITLPAIDALNNNGEKTIFGSVLDPNENQILFLLPKPLLNAIRKLGLKNLSIKVTSALDSTKEFLVPTNGVSIQLRKVKGKAGRYLVTNISSLTTPSGITFSPSALPSDDYKLKVSGEHIDVTTNNFSYRTPTLIVGTVKSKKSGFVTVEDLSGNEISNKAVAINPNGIFITEVTADNLRTKNNTRKYLNRAQTDIAIGDEQGDVSEEGGNEASATEEDVDDTIEAGIIHAVTDKDLFAVVPLDNDVETNAAIANKPIEIDDSSTLTANLGKEYEVIAEEIAKEELEELESEEPIEEGFEDFGCDIYKFADRCNIADEEEFSSIGADFKAFTQITECAFPEYELVKSLIAVSPEEANLFIGKGYCEFAAKTTEINEEKPCEAYNDILLDFKQGVISQLLCPPPFCDQFKNIKPPKCVEPVDFCEEGFVARTTQGPSCVRKPIKDLYCARIGIDVTEEECVGTTDQGITPEGASVLVTWIDKASLNGNRYCVPEKVQFTNFSTGVTEVLPENPAQRVEECETVNCHKLCEQGVKKELPPDLLPAISFTPSGQVCEVCNCHLACDAEAGKIVNCSNPKSKFFASSCCNQRIVNASFSSGPELKGQVFGGGFGFTPQSSPGFPPPIRECLCQSISNFNSKGFATQEAINRCDKCPQNFEKDQNNGLCLPICPQGTVRGPDGNCRKKCPQGFIQDDFGNCRCPEGLFVGRSGKCEQTTCPEFCKNIPLVRKLMENHFPGGGSFTPGTSSPTFTPTGSPTGNIPPECQSCFGGLNVCPSGQRKDPFTGQCVFGTCGVDQYLDQNGVCRCNSDGSVATSTGPEGCKKQSTCSSNMLPNPRANEPNQSACICPQGLPYWDGTKCVSQCSGGNPPPSIVVTFPLNSPIPCDSGKTSKCPPDRPYLHLGACIVSCPPPLFPGSQATFGTTTTSQPPIATPTPIPSPTPQPTVTTTSSPTITTTTSPPHDDHPAHRKPSADLKALHDSQLECLCPGNVRPDSNGQCGTTSANYCPPSIAIGTNGCTCNPSGGTLAGSGFCGCPSGSTVAYTKEYGCGPTTCPPATPYKCSDGSCVVTQAGCSTSNYCPGATPVGTNSCTCNPSGGTLVSNGLCQCPSGSSVSYTKEFGCTSQSTTCPAPYIRDPAFPNSYACICPQGTPYELGSTCVASCPSNLVSTIIPGGPSSSTRQVCKCQDGTFPTSAGVCASGSNYCSPAILVGTAGCTCNPSGGAYNSGGYCVCPAGSSSPYTKETGCTGSTTRPCNQGEGPSNGCYCFGGGFTGTDGKCQCSGGVTYTGAGCGTTSNYCSPGIAIGTNGCTCNPSGGTLSASGFCGCPSGSTIAYTVATGCASSSRPCTAGEGPSNGCYCFGSGFTGADGKCQCSGGIQYTGGGCGPTTNYCAPAISTTTGCTCAPGATASGPNSTCVCTTAGQTYTASGCGRICASGEVYNASNPCTCAGSAYIYQGVCTCASGQTYSASGCSPSTGGTVSLTSAVISGSNLQVTFTTNFPNDGSCAYLKDINNVTLYSLFCGSTSTTGTTISAPISSFPHTVISGDQVKICKSNDSTICSSFVTVTSGSTTAPNAPSGLSATSPSSGTVNLSWVDNSSDETFFQIYRRPSGSATWALVNANVGPNINAYTDSGPTSGTYEYKINACNAYGCSVDSNIASVTVNATVPNAPTALTVTLSGGNVVLNWTDNSTDETEFKISRRPSGGAWSQIGTTAVSIATYTDSGLGAGTYDYHVNACNASGCSPDSNIVTITK